MTTKLGISVCFLFLFGLMAVPAVAQEQEVALAVPATAAPGDLVSLTVKAPAGQLYAVLASTTPWEHLDEFQGAIAIISIMPDMGQAAHSLLVPGYLSGVKVYLRAATLSPRGEIAFSPLVVSEIE